jgi:CRISPR-associated protein Cmr6
MGSAAVPNYASRYGFDRCPPGHRFNLYFSAWSDSWGLDKDSAKAHALRQVLPLGDAKAALTGLLDRQEGLAKVLPEDRRLVIDARTTSPFATGLGLEHPIENGFAFLSPYGLPYLAGSGVKGVLRRAAEELRDNNEPGFEQTVIDALFGPEDPGALGTGAPLLEDKRRRGAVTCWDVFPVPPNDGPHKDSLVVEIMTPHYSHYYQPEKGKERFATPHDAGKPNPIAFLAVPANSAFRFVVTFEPAFLPAPLPADWKILIDRVFRHAFDWLGFGTKTAVGYGAMEEDPRAAEERARKQRELAERLRRQQEEEARQRELAQLGPGERAVREFLDARQDKNQTELSALIGGLRRGALASVDATEVAKIARRMMQERGKWKEKTEKKNPSKDYDYQDTLFLMSLLKGQ